MLAVAVGVGQAECLGRGRCFELSLFGSQLARVGPFEIVEDPRNVLDEKPVLIRHLEINPHRRCNNPTVAGKPLARSDLASDASDGNIDHAGPDRIELDFVPRPEPLKQGIDDLANRGDFCHPKTPDSWSSLACTFL